MPGDTSELQLAGGISRQPAHMRFPGQVEDANNAVFAIADGASKRPGSIYVKKIPLAAPYYGGATLVSGTVYKLHPINRDATEKYLVVYAANCLRVFHTSGAEAAVQGLNTLGLSPTPATYYASGSAGPNQLRFVSIADYTIIANTTVALGTSVTPTYTLTAEWPDYDTMVSHTPTSLPGSTAINLGGDGSYHKTNGASDGAPAGYYQYNVSGNTFPTIQFAEIGGANGGGFPYEWADTTKRGFRIRFEKRQDGFTTAAWTTATKTLTLSGNWAGYNFQAGDDVYISGGGAGGHVVAGWYKIVSRGAGGNSLTLNTEITNNNSNQSNVTGGGIGQEYLVEFAGTGGTMPSMHSVAKFIEGKLQAAGAKDALIEWTDTQPGYGYFTITAPWRGSGAKITTVTANPSHPGSDITDDTAGDLTRANGALGGYPQAAFNPTGAVLVLGGGSGPRTLSMDDRWTRVAAPGDSDGSIDPTKAPIKMVRASPATSGTVSAIATSAGSLTLITTTAAHGLVIGQMVTFASTNSTPAITGPYAVVSVPSPTTFNIADPPHVTVAGSAGTFTAPGYFTYDFITWKNRTSGTDVSNPSPKPFTTGLKIADIGFTRQRFWMLAGEWALSSATADLFRLYLDDAANLVDSDPISVQLSSDRVTVCDHFTPVRDTVLITTIAGRHFTMGAPDALTPSTVSFTSAFSLQTHSIRPVVLDSRVYLLATAKGKSQLREAYFIDGIVPNNSADVSAHVAGSAGDAGLLPATPQTICEHSNSGQVFVLAPNDNKIYVYKSAWNGNRKDQSAWTVWAVTAGTRISDIAVVDDDLFMLVENSGQFVFEKIPLFEPAPGNYPFNLHMDRQMELQGVYVNPTTTWTLPDSLTDTAISRLTLRNGTAVPVTALGATVTATGDYSAAPATLGRAYGFSITLTEPFLRDGNGNAIVKYSLHQKHLLIRHVTSGEYSVTNDPQIGASTVFTCNPPSGSLTDTNQRLVLAGGDMGKRSILISSSSATPLTIAGVTHVGDWGVRSHAGGA